jgi:hypothetical protein
MFLLLFFAAGGLLNKYVYRDQRQTPAQKRAYIQHQAESNNMHSISSILQACMAPAPETPSWLRT